MNVKRIEQYEAQIWKSLYCWPKLPKTAPRATYPTCFLFLPLSFSFAHELLFSPNNQGFGLSIFNTSFTNLSWHPPSLSLFLLQKLLSTSLSALVSSCASHTTSPCLGRKFSRRFALESHCDFLKVNRELLESIPARAVPVKLLFI